MSTNQKRLFLLEREKEGLQKSVAASDELSVRLQRSVAALTNENTALRERQSDLESQVQVLREVVQHLPVSAPCLPPAPQAQSVTGGASVTVATQTRGEESEGETEVAQRVVVDQLQVDRMQQQLSAMSEWLRTGAALLTSANAQSSRPAGGGLSALELAQLSSSGAGVADALESSDEPSSIC